MRTPSVLLLIIAMAACCGCNSAIATCVCQEQVGSTTIEAEGCGTCEHFIAEVKDECGDMGGTPGFTTCIEHFQSGCRVGEPLPKLDSGLSPVIAPEPDPAFQ